MIVTEFYMTRNDGVNLYRTYSDAGYQIERDSIVYDEAIDPENSDRVYTETTELIPIDEEKEWQDAKEILDIILGGE